MNPVLLNALRNLSIKENTILNIPWVPNWKKNQNTDITDTAFDGHNSSFIILASIS